MRRLPLATAVVFISVLAAASGCGGPAAPANPAPTTVTTGSGDGGTGVGGTAADPTPTGTAGGGSGSGSGSGSGGGQASDWPTPEDCVAYNPNNLTKRYEAGIHVVVDGAIEVMRLHGGPGDPIGDKGLAVAKRFKAHCFIGRNNHREEKNSYIFDYWRNPSGINTTIPGTDDDCSSYDRGNISVDEMGDNAYRVKDHDHVLHPFDTRTDANNGKLVLSKYSKICFLGDYDDNQGQDQVSYQL